MKKKSQIEIKVLAINTLNQWTEQVYAYEKKHFAQFLGQNIFKVDGSVKAKFDHEKFSFKGQLEDGTWVNANYWFTNAHGYFSIHVKICVSGGSYDVKPATTFCQYEETAPTLFQVKDGLLIETTQEQSDYSIRYDVADLQSKAQAIKEAADAYEVVADTMPNQFKDVLFIQHLAR